MFMTMMEGGKVNVELKSDTEAQLSLTNFDEEMPELFARSLIGWTKGILEISGAKNINLNAVKMPSKADNTLLVNAKWS